MSDRFLFQLDDKHALGADPLQWMVLRCRKQGVDDWYPISFIATEKSILLRVLKDKGVDPTPAAVAALSALPDTFREWCDQDDVQEAAE
nr:hypothetical protein 2 [Rhodospirillaceae bacterium]